MKFTQKVSKQMSMATNNDLTAFKQDVASFSRKSALLINKIKSLKNQLSLLRKKKG